MITFERTDDKNRPLAICLVLGSVASLAFSQDTAQDTAQSLKSFFTASCFVCEKYSVSNFFEMQSLNLLYSCTDGDTRSPVGTGMINLRNSEYPLVDRFITENTHPYFRPFWGY